MEFKHGAEDGDEDPADDSGGDGQLLGTRSEKECGVGAGLSDGQRHTGLQVGSNLDVDSLLYLQLAVAVLMRALLHACVLHA